MATETIVRYTDDLDGSDAASKVIFGLGKKTFEIDLNAEHAAELEDFLAPYIAKARRWNPDKETSTTPRAPRAARGSAKPNENTLIREWATENGFVVPARGRISEEIKQAYREAVGTTSEVEPEFDIPEHVEIVSEEDLIDTPTEA